MKNYIILKEKKKVKNFSNLIQKQLCDIGLLQNSSLFHSKMLFLGFSKGFDIELTTLLVIFSVKNL